MSNNKYFCTIIDAKLAARQFPGLSVEPRQDDPWVYDICHGLDDRFDRKNVPLERLVVQVEDVKLELQAVYGEHGEKLFDMPLHIEIVDAVQG